MLVPQRVLKYHDTSEFIREVQDRVGPTLNMKAAYHEVESEFETYYGKTKFSDYGSFAVMYYRNRKKLKHNTK